MGASLPGGDSGNPAICACVRRPGRIVWRLADVGFGQIQTAREVELCACDGPKMPVLLEGYYVKWLRVLVSGRYPQNLWIILCKTSGSGAIHWAWRWVDQFEAILNNYNIFIYINVLEQIVKE